MKYFFDSQLSASISVVTYLWTPIHTYKVNKIIMHNTLPKVKQFNFKKLMIAILEYLIAS